MAICNICMLAPLIARPQEPDAAGRMIEIKINSDGRRITFRSLVDRQDPLPFGMNPARQMKARSESGVVQPSILKMLQAGQRVIAAGLMSLASASKRTRKLLRRLRHPGGGHGDRLSMGTSVSTQGNTQRRMYKFGVIVSLPSACFSVSGFPLSPASGRSEHPARPRWATRAATLGGIINSALNAVLHSVL
jgi:hypothetical protein